MSFSLLTLLSINTAFASQVKFLRVTKAQRLLELVDDKNHVIKSYKVVLGRSPVGRKTQEGDNKTPEGDYILDYSNPQSKFHKAFHISYPNKKDVLRAKILGVNPGGDIMLHGLPNDVKILGDWLKTVGLEDASDEVIRAALPLYDWTWGCIAVTDTEIDEIYSLVSVSTLIRILP